MRSKTCIRSLCCLLMYSQSCHAELIADRLMVASFSADSLEQWENKKFKGETRYQLIDLDGEKVLSAESEGTASGLFKKQRVDLKKTPYLNWRWRIDKRLGKIDEQTQSGDDYAARVYVVISGGLAFWRTRALNYVWSSTSPKGMVWPNAFAGSHAMMIALRSADDEIGRWYHEKRNVLDDFKKLLGDDFQYIDAVALMTDTDNAQGSAKSYYGDIFFSSH